MAVTGRPAVLLRFAADEDLRPSRSPAALTLRRRACGDESLCPAVRREALNGAEAPPADVGLAPSGALRGTAVDGRPLEG